jgi:hypothetical protein
MEWPWYRIPSPMRSPRLGAPRLCPLCGSYKKTALGAEFSVCSGHTKNGWGHSLWELGRTALTLGSAALWTGNTQSTPAWATRFKCLLSMKPDLRVVWVNFIIALYYQVMCTRMLALLHIPVMVTGRWCFGTCDFNSLVVSVPRASLSLPHTISTLSFHRSETSL